MDPYARHILVCVGSYCSPNREGRMLYAELARLLQREGLLFGPRRVKRGETPCLGVYVQADRSSSSICATGAWWKRRCSTDSS